MKTLQNVLAFLLLYVVCFLFLAVGSVVSYNWIYPDSQTEKQEPPSLVNQAITLPANNNKPAPLPPTRTALSSSEPLIKRVPSTITATTTTLTIATTSSPPLTHLSATPTAANPFPPAVTVPSRIIASAIGLDSSVTEMGWELKHDEEGNPYSEWVVPEFTAGWHINSTRPGYGGNTVLSGHHNIGSEVFRDLIDLEAGDKVEIEAGNVRYEYLVEEKYITKEEGVSEEVRRANNRFIEPTADERLTLVSCWPYESNSHRIIVIARPVEE